ncbi:ABC transporter permease, partial [Nanoarchaeota archaeon]
EQLVRTGNLRAAVIIQENFRQNLLDGKGTEMQMIYDNTKPTTSLVATNAIKAYVSDLNQQLGEAFIREAWKSLDELNDNLRVVVKNLKKAEPVAREVKQRMDSVQYDYGSIDYERYRQTIDDMIFYLDLMDDTLKDTETIYSGITLPEIPYTDYSINNSMIIDFQQQSDAFKDAYCNSTIPNPGCLVVGSADNMIIILDQEIQKLNTQYDNLNNQIDQLNLAANKIEQSLNSLNEVFSSGSGKNTQIRANLFELQSILTELQTTNENLENDIRDLDKSINQFLTDIIQITADLENTIEVLDVYTQKDPATILRPVTVETRAAFFGTTEIFNRLPGLMSIILLFIILFISSSLIVGERKSGTMARIFLSPVSMAFFIFEKMLYLLILSVLALGSLVLATVMFGVNFSLTSGFIIIGLVAAWLYVSIGVLIGSLSKSENTSLLTCLVVGFPLMFLSGAFSPPELMSQLIRGIAKYLPLTLNIAGWEKVMIYGTGVDWTGVYVMLGMTLVFYILSVLMIKRKPTLK